MVEVLFSSVRIKENVVVVIAVLALSVLFEDWDVTSLCASSPEQGPIETNRDHSSVKIQGSHGTVEAATFPTEGTIIIAGAHARKKSLRCAMPTVVGEKEL